MDTGKIFSHTWRPAVDYLVDRLDSGNVIFCDADLADTVPEDTVRKAILAELEERGAVSKEFPRATYFEIGPFIGNKPIRVQRVDKAIIEAMGFQDRKVLPAIREIAAQVAPDDSEDTKKTPASSLDCDRLKFYEEQKDVDRRLTYKKAATMWCEQHPDFCDEGAFKQSCYRARKNVTK